MSVGAERPRLGRGLGELFQRTEVPTSPPSDAGGQLAEAAPADSAAAASIPDGAYFTELSPDAITANPQQPRTVFDEEAMAELADSIREVGLLQPVVVRAVDHGRFELVMGERRWRAAQLAGLAAIPAIVRDTADADLLRDALLENLHRAQLNPLEEAAAYAQMLEDFGCTQEELSVRIKRSRPQISNTIRLLKLPPTVQRRVAAGVLSAGHARALVTIADPAGQERLAQRIVAEGLSVRAVEELVALGERGEERQRRTRIASGPDPRHEELSRRLGDRFETRVRIEGGRTRGRIVIDYADAEDLARIITEFEK